MEPSNPRPDPHLGKILVERGVITEAMLRECLEVQRKMASPGKALLPRLGELLVERHYATSEDIRDALAVQERKILYCPRCVMQVNVALLPGVSSYRCGRCNGALLEPPQEAGLGVVDSKILQAIGEPLPPEVLALAANPKCQFGKYILVSDLGRGGVGIVQKAWDTYLGQFVALKRIRRDIDEINVDAVQETYSQSLLQEARHAVRLRHPHIATVNDVGKIGAEFYISMEFIDGRTMAQHIIASRRRGAASTLLEDPARYLRYLRDVARAVHYAHSRATPIIHCDLKPSNLIIDGSDHVFILDFGIARKLSGPAEEDEEVISGTPGYMAPEQAEGRVQNIDARTDVYALGAILYELLCGRPPFVGNSLDILRNTIDNVPPPPRMALALTGDKVPASHEELASRLETVVFRCLEKDRKARYGTAFDVAETLDRILRAEATCAGPGGVERCLSHVAEFRPDLGLAECRRSMKAVSSPLEAEKLRALEERLTVMARAFERLVGALDGGRRHFPRFRTKDRTLENVELIKSAPTGVVLFSGEEVVSLPWPQVHGDQVLDLAETLYETLRPEDIVGLALYALQTGRSDRAEAIRGRIRGHEAEALARRLML
jgi:serine/threonine protein kinase